MEREEPPPMASEEAKEPKYSVDIFDDDEDDDLFKRAIEAKMGTGGGSKEEDTSGYMTSEVTKSNTLDDIEDNELFK